MAMIEQVAQSNPEQKDFVKNPSQESLIAESDKVDYNLDEIDVGRLQNFAKMVDYIKQNGGKYGEEYRNIFERVIDPFENQVNVILDNNKEKKNYATMSNEQLSDEVDGILNQQPEKLTGQQKLIRIINNNGSDQDIQRLNEIVNDSMGEIQTFYNKIVEDNSEEEIESNIEKRAA